MRRVWCANTFTLLINSRIRSLADLFYLTSPSLLCSFRFSDYFRNELFALPVTGAISFWPECLPILPWVLIWNLQLGAPFASSKFQVKCQRRPFIKRSSIKGWDHCILVQDRWAHRALLMCVLRTFVFSTTPKLLAWAHDQSCAITTVWNSD